MAIAPQFPEPSSWRLTVVGVIDITPAMRRIQVTAPELRDFRFLPGQDLSLAFVRDDGSTVRRRYTIRRFFADRRLIELDFVLHGDGPGMRWAQSATAVATIDAIGPRGKVTLDPKADWHLFAGDATAVPGALAMIEALPPDVPARAFLQVDDATERQPFKENDSIQQVTWHFGSGTSQTLVSALRETTLPDGRGHAYLAGEVALVLALKDSLLSRGWSPDQISAKAYWNRGRANAGNGEPEQRAT
ncbi:MAG TPA: siderophore-interacting protein [Candidatus Dormibacteraeota bacterium]|nr:siderophore-interacting protein [Candidatus Dormibacteraeota bacterium]